MLEAYGNIWDLAPDYDALVITTNGFVKTNGEAVMGRGIALEAKERWPWLPKSLGQWIQTAGNTVGYFYSPDIYPDIITMPVKPIRGPNGEMGWKAKAQISIIKKSVQELITLADNYKIEKIIMPRPGCGNGGLKWENVKPHLEVLLDNRFTVVTFHP